MFKKILFLLILVCLGLKDISASNNPPPEINNDFSFSQSSKVFNEKDVEDFFSTIKEALSKVIVPENTKSEHRSAIFHFYETIEKQTLKSKNFDFLLKTAIGLLFPTTYNFSIPFGIRVVDLTTRIEQPECTFVHEDCEIPQMSKNHNLKNERYISHFGCLFHNQRFYEPFSKNLDDLSEEDLYKNLKAWCFDSLLFPQESSDYTRVSYGMNFKAFPLIYNFFLEKGINIDHIPDDKDDGQTLLGEMVAHSTNLLNIEFLLVKKAGVNLKDNAIVPLSPLQYALKRYILAKDQTEEHQKLSLQIIELLLKYGANPDQEEELSSLHSQAKTIRQAINDLENDFELKAIFKKYEKK